MSGPTSSLETFVATIQNLIVTNQVSLGIQDVWYGEQRKIPRTPTIEIIPGQKVRSLAGAPRRVANAFECFIMIQAGMVQDTQLNLHLAGQLAESVEAVIHADPTLGGICINCLVVRTEFGVAERSSTEYRAARLTVQGESRTLLPMQPNYNQ